MNAMKQILDAQQHLADLLNADPFFNDPDPKKKIVAITQRKGDLQNEIQTGLLRLGCGVIVMLPKIAWAGREKRISLNLNFAVLVTENPPINRGATGKAAEEIMPNVMRIVHWQPNRRNGNPNAQDALFKLADEAADLIEPPPGQPHMQINYIVRFDTTITLQ
jgi:hypothetical protein